MTFTIDNFLKPINPGDKNIIIYDNSGRPIHTVNPYAVINTFVNNNLVKISLSSDRVITLNFITSDLAKSGLKVFQDRLEIFKNQNPIFIDKQVEKYVDEIIDNQKKVIDNIISGADGKLNYIPRWISATALSSTGSIWDDGSSVKIGFTNSQGLLYNSGSGLLNIQTNLSLSPTFSLLSGDYFFRSYGNTQSGLTIEGLVGGLSKARGGNSPNNGYPITWTDDTEPLTRIVSTGYGTSLRVENISHRLLKGELNDPHLKTGEVVSGPSIITHFIGNDPTFVWEQKDNKRLKLTNFNNKWDFWSEAIIPGSNNEISFQNSGPVTWELSVSSNSEGGSNLLSHTKPEYAQLSVGYFISGETYTTYSLVDVTEISDIITFSSVVNISVGETITGEKRLSSGGKVDLFPENTTVLSIEGDNQTIRISNPVSYTFSTTDPLIFSGAIPVNTTILGNQSTKTILSNNLLREMFPGEKVFITAKKGTVYFGGGVGIGRSSFGTSSLLTVAGTGTFDGIRTSTFTLNPNYTLNSINNVLVGDINGDASWVPATSIIGKGFTGTSSTNLVIGEVGSYFQILTQPYLSFTPGQVVILYDQLGALYVTPSYVEGFGYNKIVAEIDGYSFSGGTMSLVTLFSQNVGSSSNNWSLQLSGAVGPQGPAGFNQGTFSVSGDIIPNIDYTYNLGSTISRWANIYVKDAIVSSQSLFLGDAKLSSEGQVVKVGDRAINKYEGTSNTTYTIGNIGSVATLITNKSLSYLQRDTIKVENRQKTFYEEDGYSEESIYGYFLGIVDFYNRDTGEIQILISYTENVGFESETWVLTLDSGELPNLSKDITGTSVTTLTIPQVGHFIELTTQPKLGFKSGQSVIVYNELPNNYEDDDYVEGNGQYFIGKVDYYYPETGLLTVISDLSFGSGTYSEWTITLSSTNQGGSNLIGGTLNNNLYLNGSSYDLLANNFENISVTSSVFDVVSDLISLDSTDNIQILADNDITIFGGGQVIFPGHTVFQQTSEVLNSGVQATSSIVTYDFSTGQTWYHSNITDNYTADFINLPITDNRILKAKIVIPQGATAFAPTNLRIDGITQSIRWKSGTYSTSPNNLDVVEFNFIRTGNFWYQVYGEINTFI